jgi:hypothetical protein
MEQLPQISQPCSKISQPLSPVLPARLPAVLLSLLFHHCRFYKLEKGNTAEQQERADLAAAQAHFGMLGWAAAALELAPGDASAPACDGLLAALLRRVVAVQEARQRGKAGPDWEGPEWM